MTVDYRLVTECFLTNPRVFLKKNKHVFLKVIFIEKTKSKTLKRFAED